MRKLSLLAFAVLLLTSSCRDVLEEIVDRVKDGDRPGRQKINFKSVGSIDLGDEGAAEISAFDPKTDRLFVINNDGTSRIDVVDLHDPGNPILLGSIDISSYGAGVNSVAVSKGKLAAAVEADPSQMPGTVVLFDTEDLSLISQHTVGALPDMVTFSPDGRYVLVANEGEPNDAYTIDPEGSVSIVEIDKDIVVNLGFGSFNAMEEALEADGFRVFGPGANLAQDVEPEYITVSDDSQTAWVALQENNGLARIDLESKMITDIFPLGFKDYSLEENAIDVSDEDGLIQLNSWPVLGMYQPDAIASFKFQGMSYVITANEGDARDYDGFSEEERVEDLSLDATTFPNAAMLQEEAQLGRLQVTSTLGDTDSDDEYEELVSFGARSFAIWDGSTGHLVFDSGNEVEKLIIEEGLYDDGRSDAKGVEPEGVAVGRIKGRTIAFIGLERVDAVMVYDVTDPYAPRFLQILKSGDAPEGLIFIPAKDSPNGHDLFIVSSEDDGQVIIFEN
ncbi:MAG: choice-of-anchor I family protein [Cyclobacteriaceae bacterium]